ncbi:MAG: VOC family protein [Armatimonadota bacterium]
MSEATTRIIPHLCCRNAEEAAAFYAKAFGDGDPNVIKGPDGKVMHGCVMIGGSPVFLVDEFPDFGALSPQSLGNSTVSVHLHVADCDAAWQRAVDAGCQVVMPLADQFWGDRYGVLVDPFGHKWSIATTVKQLSPEELQQAAASAMAEGCPGA